MSWSSQAGAAKYSFNVLNDWYKENLRKKEPENVIPINKYEIVQAGWLKSEIRFISDKNSLLFIYFFFIK